MAVFCLRAELSGSSAEMRTYAVARMELRPFPGLRSRTAPILCSRFLLEAVCINCFDRRSCTAFAHGRRTLADASRTLEENLQRFQHHTKNFCSGLLIYGYRNTCSTLSRMSLKGFGFSENVNQACALKTRRVGRREWYGDSRLR